MVVGQSEINRVSSHSHLKPAGAGARFYNPGLPSPSGHCHREHVTQRAYAMAAEAGNGPSEPLSAEASTSGSRSSNAAPPDSTLRAERSPPQLRARRREMARPRPVPSPSGLVVSKGSNSRSRISSLMPGPSSRTSMATDAPSRREESATRPPVLRNSYAALATRLRTICSILLALTDTTAPERRSVSRRIFLPSVMRW